MWKWWISPIRPSSTWWIRQWPPSDPRFRGFRTPSSGTFALIDLTLTMAQDGWLRGRELNVEMAGTLDVFWDRTERNLAFLGVLDAVRGVYSVFGRQFQVQEGTVSFPGTPGINPDLNIRAMNRVRMSGSTQLDVFATVVGPLLDPRVALSSNAAFSIAESDLVSYLVFGRPSYATATAQSTFARDAAGSFRRGCLQPRGGALLQRVGGDSGGGRGSGLSGDHPGFRRGPGYASPSGERWPPPRWKSASI